MSETKMTIVQVSELAGFEARRRELLAAEELQLVELSGGYAARLEIAKAETDVLAEARMTIQRRLDEIRGTAAAPKATRVKPEQDPEPEPGGTSIGDKIAAVLAESEEGMNTPAIAKAIGQPATIKNFATWRHAVSRALREEPKRFRKIGAGHATRYRLGGTAAAPKAQAPPEQASTPAPPDNDPAAASRADSIAAVLAEAGRAMAVAEIANEVGQPASITSWDAWRVAIGRRLRADPKRFTVTGAGRSTRYALR